MESMRYEAQQKTVQDLVNLFDNGQLNLEPGFQRDSVWSDRDRRGLMDSLFRGYPLPAIFLYRRSEEGRLVYDVIDGKQRLETILRFVGAIRGGRFGVKTHLPEEEEARLIDWAVLKRAQKQDVVTGYKLQIIEVQGSLSDIIDVFVKINSTGKALTSAEKRHARFYDSPFLRTAARVADKIEPILRQHKVLSDGQFSRMKHVELVCELMLSAHVEDVINKKAAVDKVMKSNAMTETQAKVAAEVVFRAVKRLNLLFPNLRASRFRQLADFYTLVVLFVEFEREGYVLIDRRRNQLARELLVRFSTGVDLVREKQKRLEGAREDETIYRQYLMTVLEGTDEVHQRRARAAILRSLLATIFIRKDSDRVFSLEQRRIIWNSTENKVCAYPKCKQQLTWDDFTIDHIEPHSRGGRTRVDNAQIMCHQHNASQGNRRGAA